MVAGIYTSLTGLNAFGKKLEVTANNVANLDTDGFKKSRVEFVEAVAPGAGVQPNVQKIPTSGIEVLEDTPPRPTACGAIER